MVGKKNASSHRCSFTRAKDKHKNMGEIVIQVFIFLFNLFVMEVGGLRLATITLTLNQISAALGVELRYIYLDLPLRGLLIMFYAAVFFIQRIRSLSSKQLEFEKTIPEAQEGI